MFGDVEVQNAPAIMSDHKEAIQHTEAESGNRQEVHGGNHIAMVGQKRLPLSALVSLLGSTPHRAGRGSLGHIESEFQQFAANTGSTPCGILGRHLKNEFTDFFADAFAASFVTGTPAPELAEALAVPSHDCVGADNQQRFLPSPPYPLNHNPEQLVESAELWSSISLLEDSKLLPKN